MTKKEKYVALIKDINAKHKSKNKVLGEIKVPTKRRERLSTEDELKLVYVCSNTDSIEEIEELRKKYHMRDSFTTVCDECNVSMSISDTQIKGIVDKYEKLASNNLDAQIEGIRSKMAIAATEGRPTVILDMVKQLQRLEAIKACNPDYAPFEYVRDCIVYILSQTRVPSQSLGDYIKACVGILNRFDRVIQE